MQTYLLAFFAALSVSIFATPYVMRLAVRCGAVAVPNARSMHNTPVPCIGGLAIFAGFMVAIFAFLGVSRLTLAVGLGSCLIVGLGLLDDVMELSAKRKFLAQLAVAAIPVLFGYRIEFISNPFGPGMVYIGDLSIVLTILWTVSVINVINLIDGLDGLCAGVSSIAALSLFVVALNRGLTAQAVMCAALAGASAGFLKFNFNPAKVFMGDTGAMFLGYVLAVISIQGAFKGATAVALSIPILAMGVPIFDTAFAIFRRYRRGQPIYSADKDHLHHRLVALGLSHRRAVLVIYGISAVLGGVAVFVAYWGRTAGEYLTVGVCAILIAGAAKLGILELYPRKASKDEQS